MRSMSVRDTQVLVLAGEDSAGGKGGLFERFLGKLLADQFGFEQPTTRSLNVTSEGIELDVVARHRLTNGQAIAECKAYSRPLPAADLMNFYGKLNVERFDDPAAFGIFCALPRLTPEGQEKARAIEARDTSFKYLPADDLATAMLDGCQWPGLGPRWWPSRSPRSSSGFDQFLSGVPPFVLACRIR